MSQYWIGILAECDSDTWFSTQGLRSIASAQIGSVPGDPLGDICYNFLTARFHGQVEERITHVGICLVPPPQQASHPLVDVRPNVAILMVDNL